VVVPADHGASLDAAKCVAVGFGAGDFLAVGTSWLDEFCTCVVRNGQVFLFWVHVMPNLRPALYAQFWISIPAFILSEANLSILGLGVAEPMPSWGSLLKELEGLVSIGEERWKFVPLILLVVVVTSFQLVLSKQKEMAA
jgi:hypothetical protein